MFLVSITNDKIILMKVETNERK